MRSSFKNIPLTATNYRCQVNSVNKDELKLFSVHRDALLYLRRYLIALEVVSCLLKLLPITSLIVFSYFYQLYDRKIVDASRMTKRLEIELIRSSNFMM